MSVPWGVCRVHAFWNPIGFQPEDTQLVCEAECSVPIHLQGALKLSEQVLLALSLSLSLSHSLIHSLTLCLSLGLDLSSLPMSLALLLSHSLLLQLLSHSVTLPFSSFLSFCIALSFSLSLSLLWSRSFWLSLSLSLSHSLTHSLTHSFTHSLSLPRSLDLSSLLMWEANAWIDFAFSRRGPLWSSDDGKVILSISRDNSTSNRDGRLSLFEFIDAKKTQKRTICSMPLMVEQNAEDRRIAVSCMTKLAMLYCKKEVSKLMLMVKRDEILAEEIGIDKLIMATTSWKRIATRSSTIKRLRRLHAEAELVEDLQGDVKEDADQKAMVVARLRVKTKFGKGTRPSPTPKKQTGMETTKATKLRTRKTKATELPTDRVLEHPAISIMEGRSFVVVRLRAQQFHQGRMVTVFLYSYYCSYYQWCWARRLFDAVIEMGQIRDKIEDAKLCKDDVLKLITPRRQHADC